MRASTTKQPRKGLIIQFTDGPECQKTSGWVRASEVDLKSGKVTFLELSVLNPQTRVPETRVWTGDQLAPVPDFRVIGSKDTEDGWVELCALFRDLEIIERMK